MKVQINTMALNFTLMNMNRQNTSLSDYKKPKVYTARLQ